MEAEVKAYPNPFSGELTIEVSDYKGQEVNLQIMNVMGQVVEASKVDLPASGKITLELSDLNGGVYFVRIKGDSVDQTLKLIKH